MNVTDPTVTRHEDEGCVSFTVQFPDPPRTAYLVAHEVVQQMVDRLNEVYQLRQLIRAFRDDGPCNYDHEGCCLELALDPDPCPHYIADRLIKEWDTPAVMS